MTQITIRKVNEDLAGRVRQEAKRRGESMNDVLLRLLRLHFGDQHPDPKGSARNNLKQFQQGWVEDPAFDNAMEQFSQIEADAWNARK